MKAEDTACLAEVAEKLIGVVRVAQENGALVSLGMHIAKGWRRCGIGTRTLQCPSRLAGVVSFLQPHETVR